MKPVDLLITNSTIVTMDDQYRVIQDGALAVSGDSILAVGPAKEIEAKYKPNEILDAQGKITIPGLINAHTHAAMTLLRGLADDLRLDVWLMGFIMPVEREFVSPDFCRLGSLIACAEMIRGGITCFADMYYFEDTVASSVAEAGMRAICGQTILKFPAPDAEAFEDSLDSARKFIERWIEHPLIIPAVAPHAPYTCTQEILEACTQLALEYDVPVHIHIAETKQEVEEWRDLYEMPVVPWVKKVGLFQAKVIAAHCVHIDDGEIRTLEHSGVGVVHNPSSNLKLASGFAPVSDMITGGLNIGVGTDGPASNNDLDLFEEMRLASFIAKATTGDPTTLPAREAFSLATRSGAKALHIGHLTGSLEVGKKADLVLLELDQTHSLPHFDRDPNAIYARIVYASKSTDVSDVMVNGQWLLRERQLLTLDETELLREANDYAKRIDSFLIKREGSVLSKLVAIGGAEQEESYEIQLKVKIANPEPVIEQLENGNLEILRTAHYQEYDTYFSFPDPLEGRLRYREDEFVDKNGRVFHARARLTLTGPAAEREYPNSVLLSRSRFIAPAIHSPRFYREYFKPSSEQVINKDRLRWLVRFNEVEFFINVDRVLEPAQDGCFLEIKSRTWSRRDAELKAELIPELLSALGVADAEPVRHEYPDLVFKAE